MACSGTPVADVGASRVGLLVVDVVGTDVDADLVACAVVKWNLRLSQFGLS